MKPGPDSSRESTSPLQPAKPTTLDEAIRMRILELCAEKFKSSHIPEMARIISAPDSHQAVEQLKKFYPQLTHDMLVADAEKILGQK